MERKSKAETFVGFVVRARKCKIGFNACATLKKADLMIVCKTASLNSKKEALSLSKKLKCELISFNDQTLEELTHKENAKVMAVVDKSLSEAIKKEAQNEFTVVIWENN